MAPRTLAIVGLVVALAPATRAQEPRPREVRNEVEGLTTILLLKAPGPVAKGDLILELDSAGLRDRLAEQEIATREAQADFEIAEKSAQTSETAARDAVAVVDQEIADLTGTARTQELEVKLWERKLADAKEKQGTGQGRGDLDGATVGLERAKAVLATTRSRINTLTKYTKERRRLEAEIVARAARSDSDIKKGIWNLQKSRGDKLKRMIAKCRVVAPIDGVLTYPGTDDPGPGDDWIGEGATVRERQVLALILPD